MQNFVEIPQHILEDIQELEREKRRTQEERRRRVERFWRSIDIFGIIFAGGVALCTFALALSNSMCDVDIPVTQCHLYTHPFIAGVCWILCCLGAVWGLFRIIMRSIDE